MSDKVYDVAVIGLGALGAAVTYQLAARGVNVVGIDRFSPPHDHGSSHGDTRITRASVGEGPAYVPIVKRSHEIWRALEAQTDEGLFEQCGVMVFTSGDDPTSRHGKGDFTRQTIDLARTHGIEHEVLDAAQIRSRFAQFAPVGDGAIAYYEPGGGYVRPERCIRVQLDLARSLGATLLTDTTVDGVHSGDGGVVISAAGQSIRAERAVVSAGMWNAGLLGAPFDELLTVYRQKLYWFELEEPSIFPAVSPSFIMTQGPTDDDVCYGFPPIPGEGSVKIAAEQFSVATAVGDVDRVITPAESDEMYRRHIAGRIAGVSPRVVKTSVCTYTVTPDFDFIVDRHPAHRNVTVVSACSGHGFKHSAALGEAVAQQVVSGASDLDLGPFSLARFVSA